MKDKTTAAVLALLLGNLGIHKFYVGDSSKGILYLLLTLFGIGWIVVPILALIDAINLFTMTNEEFSEYVSSVSDGVNSSIKSENEASNAIDCQKRIEILKKFKELLDNNVISEEVFNKVKQEIL